ncbi:hypothetical protein EJK48_1247 [Moraxella catarrhalis]|nr:hypothetical protein EJK48_1247 [Moraxella catarrhalis]
MIYNINLKYYKLYYAVIFILAKNFDKKIQKLNYCGFCVNCSHVTIGYLSFKFGQNHLPNLLNKSFGTGV